MSPVESYEPMIREILGAEYGMYSVDSIEYIPKGRATNFLIRADGRLWLCKFFQDAYAPARIEAAARYVGFLRARGYPVKQFRPARGGAATAVLQGRAVALIPYIEGEIAPTLASGDGPRLASLGCLCGQIHALSSGYDRAEELQESPPANWSIVPAIERFRRLVSSPQIQDHPDLAQQIRGRLDLLDGVGRALLDNAQRSPLGVIHGDYFADHVVWGSDSAWVIDVLGSYYYPGWELMRAFFQSIPAPSSLGDDALAQLWQPFIGGYRDARRISGAELVQAYDLYLLQLIKSPYGITPDTKTIPDIEKREQLLAFGRWRTLTGATLGERRVRIHQIFQGI